MRAGPRGGARAGIFYYYQVFGKALSLSGGNMVVDSAGKQHDWRIELINKLTSLQNPDGSFIGERNWMEDNPVLATAMATLALQDAVLDLKK
jgi:squalene-hopene/tetraprenyl-beta-curcumene cyclase